MNTALSRSQLVLFALPAIMQAFLHAPAASLLQGIYAKHGGIALTALGTAILVARLFDGVIDPVIGLTSDAWRRRHGTYKPFVAAGTVLTMMGLWMLYRPGPGAGVVYFTVWYMVASLGWSITEIPYRAWGMQLSREYVMRTRIQSAMAGAIAVGTLAFFMMPLAAKPLGLVDSTEFNFQSLNLAAIVIVILMPVVNLLALWKVPDGEVILEQTRIALPDIWKALVGNGPLHYFILTFVLVGLSMGISEGVTYFFIDGYLQLGQQLAGLLLLLAPLSLIGIPLWSKICQRYERHKVWAACVAVVCVSKIGYLFIEPGSAALMPMFALSCIATLFGISGLVAAPAMVGDIIDYGRSVFGRDHSGIYIAFYSIIVSAVHALGASIGLIFLGRFGYEPSAPVQTAEGVRAIWLVAVWIPTVAMALAVPLLWRFPLTRSKHEQILRDIAGQSRDAAAATN